MQPRAVFGPVPLMLGVVGHRKLPDSPERLHQVVRDLLLSFSQRYPSTRIVLLAALAEGADRLVAREALGLGFSLIVPLPMEPEEYEKDFVAVESRAEFRALLGRAESSFVVPPNGAETIGEARPRAYANCNAYIVRQCVELIALWDGGASPIGGTAEAVGFQLDGIPAPYVPEHNAFDPSLCGPVLHVMTPRGARDANQPAEPFSVTVRYPRAVVIDPAKGFERAKYDIERFNRDAIRGNIAERVRGLPNRLLAEGLANAYQRRTTTSLFAISAALFLAIVAFNLYTTFSSHPLALMFAYLFFTATAFVPYLASRHGDWQLRYQDYRALEQALRTDECWHMAGIDRPVASRFAESERSKIDWIVIALRALTEPPGASSRPAQQTSREQLQLIYREWVLDQYRYFTQFAGKREHIRERISSRAVTAGVAFSIVLTVGSRIGSSFGFSETSMSVLLFGATMLAVGAALIHNFAEKRGWSEHSRHYELMAALFGYAVARIAPLLDESQPEAEAMNRVRVTLITLGDEAIRETVAWLNLHRSRPLSVPQV